MASRTELCCEIILAILLPPLGVCFRHGCCSVEFFICLILTILGYIPGIIYAIYAIVVVDHDSESKSGSWYFGFNFKLEFFICLVLTILGYIPGIIYAVYVILSVDRDRYRSDYTQPIIA
ncbi:hypothetical protein HHK36_021253 [Tetracentron sinense]|uniref:Uncharacterized protein n=1 Tax=Tetracentron sinense TaxID=13715 RepID=A0A834YR58_TETSI|nr:hypothetical protein HHK36_021253 [Tetracentron sinense]